MADFEKAINETLRREGGSRITRDQDDPGGTTKFGISQRSYPDVDIANLTEFHAKEIYKRDYWNRVGSSGIVSQVVAEKLFDTAVNVGVRTASRLAQKVVDAEPDGIIGPNSRLAINLTKAEDFIMGFTIAQIAYYVHLVRRRPKSRKYLLGWVSRALGEV